MLIKEFLRPLNIEIHHVTDGIDAINFIKMNPDVSLILMDIKLPFMDGYEATKVIKQINPKIPIIAQTSYAMLGDREKAIIAGCDDYITKPLDLKKLQELVKNYLSN
jgi:CheY-like chemotaxis protein